MVGVVDVVKLKKVVFPFLFVVVAVVVDVVAAVAGVFC